MYTRTQIIVTALTAILFLGAGCATTKTDAAADTPTEQTQNHKEHHPEGAAQTTQKVSDQSGMMGKSGMMGDGMMGDGMMGNGMMNMNQMMGMMDKCMTMHEDGKMCDQQMMEKCQEKMDQADCNKMRTQMKNQEKIKKNKK